MDDNATTACLQLAQDFQLNYDSLVFYAMIFVSFTLVNYTFRKVRGLL